MSVYAPAPTSSGDMCAGCGQGIGGEHIIALGKMWHMVSCSFVLPLLC